MKKVCKNKKRTFLEFDTIPKNTYFITFSANYCSRGVKIRTAMRGLVI